MEMEDPFLCILHSCIMSRVACEKRRTIDAGSAWAKALQIECESCRNPEVVKLQQPSRTRKDTAVCVRCRVRKSKNDMEKVPGYRYHFCCKKCSPEDLKAVYHKNSPKLKCAICGNMFLRKYMHKYSGSRHICSECKEL